MQIAYKIVVNGSQDITKLIADRLLSLTIVDRAGVKSDRLTLTIDDRDQRLELPKVGAKIEVSLGYIGQQLVKIGRYAVDEIEVGGPVRSMTISANAADMNGKIKAPKERSFPGVTFGSLVQTIAQDNGLTPSISDKLAARNLGHIDQTESDMQLLSRICTEQGATMKVQDGRLIIAEHAQGKTRSGGNLPAITIKAEDCADWSATLSERGKYGSVKAYWQDLQAAQRKTVQIGSAQPVLTLKQTYPTESDARTAADSKLKALGRGTGTVTINGMVGNPNLAAECIATLQGFRTGVDGSGWVVNEVTHNFSAGNGYTNSVQLETK